MFRGWEASCTKLDFEMEIDLGKKEGIFHFKMWKCQQFQNLKWKSTQITYLFSDKNF